ncbi:hypothetical protein M9458_051215, partial [Cirrhinus mrigala]
VEAPSLAEEVEDEVDMVAILQELNPFAVEQELRAGVQEQLVNGIEPVPVDSLREDLLDSQVSLVEGLGGVDEPVLRRTGRVIAGRHTNPHHLPRPVGE